MTQPSQRLAQRRTDTQQAGTYTFWYRRMHVPKHVSAWMLSQSNEEAAFLTTSADAPRVGEQVELSGSYRLPVAHEKRVGRAGLHLRRFGRVVRLDDPLGTTRRVAIRFEQPTRLP